MTSRAPMFSRTARTTTLLIFLLLVLLPHAVRADHSTLRNDTFNTLPDTSNQNIRTQLQTFADHEIAQLSGRHLSPFVFSGGLHGTSASLTTAAFATDASVPERVNEAATAVTYSTTVNNICWLIVSADNNGITSWTRVGETAYYYFCEGDSTPNEPLLPANSAWLSYATITGCPGSCAIATVTDRRRSNPQRAQVSVVNDPLWNATGDGAANDTTPVQNALTNMAHRGGGVVLVPPNFVVSVTQLSIPTEVCLVGSGRSSIVQANSATEINPIVLFTGVNRACVRDLTIEGLSLTATISSGTVGYRQVGVSITGGSTDILVENLYIHDVFWFGIYIPNASRVVVQNVDIADGVGYEAILIGPANNSSATVEDIKLSNITVRDICLEGIGIWREPTINGGTVRHIYLDNIKVYNQYRLRSMNCGGNVAGASSGHAFWSSQGANGVVLTNFIFDGNNAGANTQDGIHIEGSNHFQISNGIVKNQGGEGFTVSTGTHIALTNVRAQGNVATGFSGSSGSNSQFIQITNCIAFNNGTSGFLVGGRDWILTNNIAVENGTTGANNAGFLLQGQIAPDVPTRDIVLTGNKVYNTLGTIQYGITFSDNLANITLKGNRFNGSPTGAGVRIAGSSVLDQLHGEWANIHVRESVAAGSTYSKAVFLVPTDMNVLVTNVYLMFSAAITQSGVDYNTYSLQRLSTAGAIEGLIVAETTRASDGSNFTANTPRNLGDVGATFAIVTSGKPLRLDKAVAGAGQPEADGVLAIEYITY